MDSGSSNKSNSSNKTRGGMTLASQLESTRVLQPRIRLMHWLISIRETRTDFDFSSSPSLFFSLYFLLSFLLVSQRSCKKGWKTTSVTSLLASRGTCTACLLLLIACCCRGRRAGSALVCRSHVSFICLPFLFPCLLLPSSSPSSFSFT